MTSNKRSFERICTPRYQTLHVSDSQKSGYLADISRGGMLLYSATPLAATGEKTRFHLSLRRAGASHDFTFDAVPRWSTHGEDVKLHVTGLQFADLPDDEFERLSDAIRFQDTKAI